MIYPNPLAVMSKFFTRTNLLPCLRLALLVSTLLVFVVVEARPQDQNPPAQPQGAPKPARKKRYRLRVTKGEIIGISLKADKARMSEIAAELSKRLGAQVILASSLAKEALTVEFYDLPLEPALRLLAPQVYVDYEIQASGQPKVLAVYLEGVGDPDPALTAVVQGSSQAMMIEGNTEDVEEQPEEHGPLEVELNEGHLTIKSRKQPLVAVILTVAEILSVPAEIKFESKDILDTEIKDTPFEEAIPRLSPNIRLYVRADLTRSKRLPLRVVLLPPATNVADPSNIQ